MTWSDRSAWRARRWWDRAVHRHARQGLKIPGHDRSFCFLCQAIPWDGKAPRGGLIGEAANMRLLSARDNRVRHMSRQGDLVTRPDFATIVPGTAAISKQSFRNRVT